MCVCVFVWSALRLLHRRITFHHCPRDIAGEGYKSRCRTPYKSLSVCNINISERAAVYGFSFLSTNDPNHCYTPARGPYTLVLPRTEHLHVPTSFFQQPGSRQKEHWRTLQVIPNLAPFEERCMYSCHRFCHSDRAHVLQSWPPS